MCLERFLFMLPVRGGGMEIFMPRNVSKERKTAMYEAILQLKDLDECYRFFEDLCAVTELRAMEQRYEVASMLLEDKVYMEIMEKSNASSATISRVNRMLNYGTGCLPEIIRRLQETDGQDPEASKMEGSMEADKAKKDEEEKN